jgi:hypothetical protein
MQQILRREPLDSTFSNENKHWGRTKYVQFIFGPYRGWITSLYRNVGGWDRTEESIMSGVNAMRLVFESLV